MSPQAPLVTLGVPVYNGEAHLEPALRGLLAQTWPHLEILISDNASTDGTEALCRRFAAEDPRIRYVRQPENLGAAGNFEFLAHAARGELFAWCAHDDLRMPDFVTACATELLRRPDAVLCNSAVVFLDEAGRLRPDWGDLNFETRDTSRPERAQRLVDHMDWVDMYGLIRRDALLRALPIEPVWGGDVVISMKLLMLGEFAKVDAPLFQYRVRSRPKSPEQTMWDFAKRDGGVPQPYTEMLQALLRVPMQAAADRAERADLMARFLRAIVDLERREPEQQQAEALALVIGGARRVLVAVDGSPRRIRRALGALCAIGERLPGVACALLCPESWIQHGDPIPEAVALLPYVPLSNRIDGPDESDDVELARVRAWRPDLVLDFSARRSRRLDLLATGSRALLGFARERHRIAVGPFR
ncbi:MAG: glycosyltransferase family 2 protein, partial [Myxococcota bacterium]|nr:glycosyltransferase family 2 protein [Myxococcota bacterium]